MDKKYYKKQSIIRAGEVRPSQVIWTYGPGAIIDLQNVSVMALGLQNWEWQNWDPVYIEEPRLLAQIRRLLPYVSKLRVPPVAKESLYERGGFKNDAGMPVSLFPRWYRCRSCGLLGSIDSGSVFEVKGSSSFNLKVVHKNCPEREDNKSAPAVPARFLIACKNGHISDFPWREYVHNGPTTCTGVLRFRELGSSLQTEHLSVKCEGCGKRKTMAMAFGASGQKNLPNCPGMHPHFANAAKPTKCDAPVKTLMLGASNGWFPKVLTVLSLPMEFTSPLASLYAIVRKAENDLDDIGAATKDELKSTLSKNIIRNTYKELANYSADEIWEALERIRNNTEVEVGVEDSNEPESLFLPEWRTLTSSKIPFKEDEFEAVNVPTPIGFEQFFSRVVLVNRLKEVRALVGFTRLEAEDPMLSQDSQPQWGHLSAENTTWLPAMEMRGEGIFIQFNEETLQQWEALDSVKDRENKLRTAHDRWRLARNKPVGNFPGIRYVLLHTFAHIMIRELSLACGYNSASIRERIYASPAGDEPMAGILLYTSASDSDGTLGGLVDLGKPENLRPLLLEGLNQARTCSSDPLCSEYDPCNQEDGALDIHLAACHACSYVAETSCEVSNRYLDRALLVDTLVGKKPAFFNLSFDSL